MFIISFSFCHSLHPYSQTYAHFDPGQQLSELVVIADNAPAHSRLEQVFDGTEAVLLRLAPYSPMLTLNPIEKIWSKIKSFVKAQVRVPQVEGSGIQEQRLQYLENILQQAMGIISPGDCCRSAQHTSTFYEAALNHADMSTGL